MFGKGKKKVASEGQFSLLGRWCGWCNRQLLRGAALLQARISTWPKKRIWLMLVSFCLVFSGASVYTVVSSLTEKAATFQITPIRMMPLREVPGPGPLITEEEYHRIHRLRIHLDSLRSSVGGNRPYDSLLQKHPHLMDTLTLLERLYSKQN